MDRLFLLVIPILTLSTPLFAKEKIRLAVIDLLPKEGFSNSATQTVTGLLQTEPVNSGKFDVIERGQMDSILKEQSVQ